MKRFLLLLLLCSAPLVELKANIGAASADLDQFVEKWLTDNKVSGVSVGLIKVGRLAFAKGYGLANRETKLVPTGDTVWSMASCSKPAVGIAALKLVDQGKLDLDKDVSEYLGFPLRNPNFPDEKITMRELLAHASSLKDASQADISSYSRPDPPQQLEKDVRTWLLSDGAEFANGAYWDASAKPGAKYAYANVGSTVAGLVVEKAAGQLLNEFCNQHIFTPLGLTSTRWFFRELPDPAKVAMPYDETFQPHGHYGFAEYPSGQLRSSVADFSKLLLMLINQGELGGQRILSAASVAEMQRVQFPALDPEGGLHLGVGASAAGVQQYSHQGAESGVGTYFLYQPDKTGALFMSNGSLKSPAYDSLMKRLLDEIPKLQAPAPPTITTQPQSQTVAAGATVKFTVQAQADPPVTVQWKFNDTALADSATISGAKTPTLTLTSVTEAQAGNYTVSITDPDGSTTSAVAVLTVQAPIAAAAPAITAQPKAQTIATGASVTLSVTATGDAPLSYQWKLNSADIPGATSATLTVSNAQAANAGSYTVIVTNPAGVITSEPAVITVTAPPPPPPPQTGLLADNGFRPTSDGFKFENYGKTEGRIDLTPAELQRMFGDRVFATSNGAEKILTPAAQKWMEETSKSMNGGHCEGMAVVSLLIYARNLDSPKFGAARTVDLELDGNPALQREIAYWWATQVVDPTRSTEIFGTPTEVLDKLIEALKPGVKETYTVGVRQEGKGGHAVTPYAVEEKGGGIVDVLVYDNNHPNKERRLIVDRNKNTWSFSLSTNPAEPESIWAGDAATRSFSLSPSSPRLQTQVAPFLEETVRAVSLNGLGQPATVFNEIWVDGDGVKILISDPLGKRYGYEAGKFYREIAGVTHRMLKGGDELWKDSPSPTYYVPVGQAFTLTLDGSAVKKMTDTAVTMIGPGYDLSIEEIHLDPNQKDTIVFSPDGKSISYKTSSNESPEISLGFETPGADYDFTVKGVDIEADSTLTIRLDKTKNTLSISTAGNDQVGTYALSMGRLDKDTAQYFDHDEIELRPNDTATLDFGKWAGNKATMPLMIDRDSNGTVDETIQLTDEEKVTTAGPKLSAQAVAGGKIKVSWPATAADFILEANSTLTPTGWTAIPANQLATEGVNKVFTETGNSTTRFYRLRKN